MSDLPLVDGLRAEQPVSREHFVKNAAESINVRTLVQCSAPPLFWRHIRGSAGAALRGARQPEIGDHRAAAFVDQNVARLEVAMQQPGDLARRMLHTLRDLQR